MVIEMRNVNRVSWVVAAVAACCLAAPALAGYAQYGHGMGTVLSGSLDGGALYLGTNTTWVNTGTFTDPPGGIGMVKPYNLQTSFTIPACDSVVAARLVMTVWGGTADYTCGLSVDVNGGNALGGMTLGSTSDANPTFSPTQACVYGSGYGVWLVSVPVPVGLVNTDGAANLVSATVTDPTQAFDGRIQQVSMLAVYQDAALNNTFDYVVAEGSGNIYRDEDLTMTPPKVESRDVGLGSVDPTNVTGATLHALYTYGTDEQNDRLYFNGVQYGSDDVADFDADTSPYDFGPDLVSFDVTADLDAANIVTFTVSDEDGVPDTREYSLRPHLAVLEVTHVPEPVTIALLGFGGMVLLPRRKRG